MVVVLPKEKPVPAAVLLAGVPKLNEPPGLGLVWPAVPKLKPPPVAAGAELVRVKPPAEAVAVVFWAWNKPEGWPKLNPPLIVSLAGQNGHFLGEPPLLLAGRNRESCLVTVPPEETLRPLAQLFTIRK